MISTAIDEAKVQKLFPNEDLHGLKDQRICFSYDLLKCILESNKKIQNAFLDLCKEKLIKKSFKSLDFYDVYKIFCAVIVGRYYLKIDEGKLSYVGPDKILVNPEKIELNMESAANFTFQKIDDENINENINEKIKSLENRLNNLESRLDKLEKK